jgi:purine-cytosine permease-like protein
MKKHFIAIAKVLLTIVAAIGIMCIGMMQEWRTETIIAAFLFGGIIVALLLGFFDIEDKPTHWNIKQGARSMRRAA